jgi:hypothetical protein
LRAIGSSLSSRKYVGDRDCPDRRAIDDDGHELSRRIIDARRVAVGVRFGVDLDLAQFVFRLTYELS